MIVDVLSWVLLGTGALFSLVGGIGMLRLPDFYTRMHAAGITDTMGAGCILGGLALQAPDWLVVVKLGMIFFFLLLTSPTSGHALARAALFYMKPLTVEEEGEA